MPDRSHEVTRLEGFSDAVFGFALTLLVVTLETPRSVDDLSLLARGFVPFALMFAMVCWIWYEHNVFFRRYGLQDAWTVFLNSVLLFVVLFYVYPLKFLTNTLVGPLFGLPVASGAMESWEDSRLVMLLYSGGVVLIFGCFTLLYRRAWKARARIRFTARETVGLRFRTRSHVLSMSFGLLSIAIVLAEARWAPVAGPIYILMGPAQGWNGYRGGQALAALDRADTEAHDAER